MSQENITKLQAENGALRIVLQLIIAQLTAPARIPINIEWLKKSAISSVDGSTFNGDHNGTLRTEMLEAVEDIFAPFDQPKK